MMIHDDAWYSDDDMVIYDYGRLAVIMVVIAIIKLVKIMSMVAEIVLQSYFLPRRTSAVRPRIG